jgi:hypothetical protein
MEFFQEHGEYIEFLDTDKNFDVKTSKRYNVTCSDSNDGFDERTLQRNRRKKLFYNQALKTMKRSLRIQMYSASIKRLKSSQRELQTEILVSITFH